MGCIVSKDDNKVLNHEEVESLNSEKKNKDDDGMQTKGELTTEPVDGKIHLDLSYAQAASLTPKDINEMWDIVHKTADKEAINVEPAKNRKRWKTIRVFVSSTFRDFYQEREVLVKEIFPDLRLWCEERKLRLIECDLRWGVPKGTKSEDTIRICLGEIDRCADENVAPFFLNLCGERAGWIPTPNDIADNLAAHYGWVYGLSVTEMEIVHGAFRNLNPNAFFMIREPDGFDEMTFEEKKDFCDGKELSVNKLNTLKSKIAETFPENHHCYKVNAKLENEKVQITGLSGEDAVFYKAVTGFFKKRIEELYPLDDCPEDTLEVQKEAHETFMETRSHCVIGRDKIIKTVEDYYTRDSSRSPMLVVGVAGAGKSALVAKCAKDAVVRTEQGFISLPKGYKKWNVFYHFIGATPGSTDLAFFLQRLTKEMNKDSYEMINDLDGLILQAYNLLSNVNTEPMLIFIDALNQLDEDKQQFLSRWIPKKLSPNVRVLVSVIEGTKAHQILRAYKPSPKEVVCEALDEKSRREIVEIKLKTYSKRLHPDEMNALISKDGSSNPLWLTLVCEELRVHGTFENVIGKIQGFPSDLIELEMEVFSRFESEADGTLMRAALCLLEVSRHGLLEIELLELLGESSNIECPSFDENWEELSESHAHTNTQTADQVTDKLVKEVDEAYVIKDNNPEDADKAASESAKKTKQVRKFLPARDWAIIHRNLKPLIRPCGDLGEGRLDFYHRSLSKAVRIKYFTGSDAYQAQMYNYWHAVLAGFFEGTDDMDRKAEELPFHLVKLLDNNRLIKCLVEWPVFNRMYNEEFSIDLLGSWQKAGGYSVATAMYKEALLLLKQTGMPMVDFCDQQEKVATFLSQAGQYMEPYRMFEECANLEVNSLGCRPNKLADLYAAMALFKHEDLSTKFETLGPRGQLEGRKVVLELCKKSNNYREQLTDKDNEYKKAKNNIVLSYQLFTIAIYENRRDDKKYQRETFAVINDAIGVFEKLNEMGQVANALANRTYITPSSHNTKDKLADLMKARELLLKVYGENHKFYVWNCGHIAMKYAALGQRQEEYDYYVMGEKASVNVFGPTHPETIRAKNIVEDHQFEDIRQQRERLAAGTA